ncbi:RHS repeat-associated core domain-containing protein [Pseudomonas petrae]|uniref:RHS repeat-associated core domain-containing protein n=1 Tax=Pseudomonas petrae TaxID=2912190 RepID=UPI003B00737B
MLQTQQWDPAGRLHEQRLGRSDDKSVLIKRAYQYDAAGQLTDINDSRRGPLSYRYDPVSRLLSATSRLGTETFAFDPASNLLNESAVPVRRPLDPEPARHKLVDNLLRDYAGNHYEYDERGNQTERWTNGLRSELHWDLFDRLVHFCDPRLTVDFGYDPLGRRLYKLSKAHYRPRPEAGTGWNENEHARKERELGCGFTLYGWDGDNLAWESSPPPYAGALGRTVHYIHEPGTFVPVAQAIRHETIRLVSQPTYQGRYNFKEDPLWTYKPVALPIDVLAWYQCDHLGTPQEITDQNGHTAWSAQYKAWGEAQEQRSEFAQKVGLTNPIRFQAQYHDHETGLHYNRHRYYDPRVGRFISKDPIGYSGGLNLYHYVPNPTGWIDPLGLSASSDLPRMKGWSTFRAGVGLDDARFLKVTDNGVNEMWKHSDGSVVKVHKYGNQKPCGYKSGNNAHIHKVDPSGNALDDHGTVTTDPNKSHIGIRNPIDLPTVRGRPHGS